MPDVPRENRILIDWLSFTSKNHSVADIIRLLGMENVDGWETVTGAHGFRCRQYFGGISIHHHEFQQTSNLSKEWIWLEMSGQGCRTFETYGHGDYEKIFELARSDPTSMRITRLDVAFDDMTGVLDINVLCDETRLENYTSRIEVYQSIYSNRGNSVYFGTRYGNVFIRIYDKAEERGYNSAELHWLRCELQLKDEIALGFAKKLKEHSISELYRGTLKNYLLYREPRADTNKRRWQVRSWWDFFLDDAIARSLWEKPGVAYNLSACERYVLTQPVGSIKTLIAIHGKDAFIEMIKNAPPSKNPKYKRLIKEARADMKKHSGYAFLDTVIQGVGDDELDFINDIKVSLNELTCVLKNAPKLKNRKYQEISAKVFELRELLLNQRVPDKLLEFDTDEEMKKEYDELKERALKREKEYKAERSKLFLKNHGLDLNKKN